MKSDHLKYISERHRPVGYAMDEERLQDPLDVVEGVTHAGQAATQRHTLEYSVAIKTSPCCGLLNLAQDQGQRSDTQRFHVQGLSCKDWDCVINGANLGTDPNIQMQADNSLYDPLLAGGEVIFWRVDERKAEVEH